MKRLSVFFAAVGIGFFAAQCNPPSNHSTTGNYIRCQIDSDCPTTDTCRQGVCYLPNGQPDYSSDGGGDAGHDGGYDSGQPCVNLQCQQVQCVTGMTALAG